MNLRLPHDLDEFFEWCLAVLLGSVSLAVGSVVLFGFGYALWCLLGVMMP